MELQFSKTDLGRLVRGDWELVCGRWEQADRIGKWLTIKSDGLYLNDCEKAPKPWVHPGREGLVLPLPTFTLEQFKAFCDWHPTFEWEAIESVFTNDDGTLDEGALKELASRGEAAAAMVCGVLAGADDEYLTAWETSCQIDECRAEIAELKSLKPTTITERAIAKQELEKLESRLTALLNPDAEPSTTESLEPAVPAQQQPEPAAVEALPVQPKAAAPAPVVAESASKAVVVPFKKAALIAAHVHEWPTIERDIADANTNGLAAAAKAGARGWKEDAALVWARANGKLISAAKPANSLAQAMHNLGSLPHRKHTIQG